MVREALLIMVVLGAGCAAMDGLDKATPASAPRAPHDERNEPGPPSPTRPHATFGCEVDGLCDPLRETCECDDCVAECLDPFSKTPPPF